jgi:hypothetical protein
MGHSSLLMPCSQKITGVYDGNHNKGKGFAVKTLLAALWLLAIWPGSRGFSQAPGLLEAAMKRRSGPAAEPPVAVAGAPGSFIAAGSRAACDPTLAAAHWRLIDTSRLREGHRRLSFFCVDLL